MKVKFANYDSCVELHLEPETMQEVSDLAALAINCKSEKPDIIMSFYKDGPAMSVFMKKVHSSKRKSTIKPDNFH